MTLDDAMPVWRLFIYGGDSQDFTDLDSAMREASKVLDPSKVLGSSVTIEVNTLGWWKTNDGTA